MSSRCHGLFDGTRAIFKSESIELFQVMKVVVQLVKVFGQAKNLACSFHHSVLFYIDVINTLVDLSNIFLYLGVRTEIILDLLNDFEGNI